MNRKNTIIEHYKKFFDLHAKGIALDEDDHLNIDWADDLVKNCFIADVSNRRELLKAFGGYLAEQYPNCKPVYLEDIDLFLDSL